MNYESPGMLGCLMGEGSSEAFKASLLHRNIEQVKAWHM
jgi:hypothetical protein